MTKREVFLWWKTKSFQFLWLALAALSCEQVVAGDPSFFSCNGKVYDQANDRIRSFAIGFNLGKTVGVERALVFFDNFQETYPSVNRPYGMAHCRRDANTTATCTVSSDDANSGLPQELTFVRDEKGNLKFSSDSGLVGVTLFGKRCEPPGAPRWFQILDVSYVGTKADPALYGTKVTIRPNSTDEIVECGGEIKGFYQGERRHYRGWFSESDGGSCTVSEGDVPGTKVLWMTKKATSQKIEPGFYYLDRVWIYEKGDRWPSNEDGSGFDGFIVPK